MVQYVKQGNIFGRIGTAIGKGLEQQIPKEVERNRLANSLEELGNRQDLSPFQRFSGLVGAAHEYPQVVQSAADLLKAEALRNSFTNQKGRTNKINPSAQPNQGKFSLKDINFANQNPNQINRSVVQENSIPSNFANREEEALSNRGLVQENPAQQRFIPPIPWTPEQRDEDIGREAERHPELSFEQLQARSADNERRFLEAPEAYRQQQEYLKNIEDEADAEFDKQLETALQKEGPEVYKDLTGDTLLDLKKAMRHDLAINPNLNPKTAAEKWRKKGKDFVEHKNLVKEQANRSLDEKILPSKKEETLRILKNAQKIYADLGKKREFYNMLRSKNIPPTYEINPQSGKRELINEGSYGFDASPGNAALIAYPRSQPLKTLIKNTKRFPADPRQIPALSRKLADDFANNRTNEDSILAFMKQVKDTNPYFDEYVFINYLQDNQNKFAFNPDQVKELSVPVSDFFSNWGDLALFPLTGRSVAHD